MNMPYDENHHIQKLKLHDKNGSHKVDPTKKMHVSEDQQEQETNMMECNTIIKFHKLNMLISK